MRRIYDLNDCYTYLLTGLSNVKNIHHTQQTFLPTEHSQDRDTFLIYKGHINTEFRKNKMHIFIRGNMLTPPLDGQRQMSVMHLADAWL